MKPTRNHIYCPSCGREKMLFASQAKADAFIRYNSGKILEETGKAPVTAKQVYAVVMSHPDTFVPSEGRIRLII